MKISEGDIVRRKVQPGRSVNDPWWPMTASSIFYDGYYIVIDIMTTTNVNNKGTDTHVSICKIMDHHGQFNWIATNNLLKIS